MPTTIRLAPDIETRLATLAARTGRSKSYYLREIIARGLEEIEDYYLASATLERVRKGEERVYSLEEVERDLGLAD
jgi:RHH-type rel operon transcriptional repressor/antitoxin RelB